MSIQSNINQSISIAGLLFSQTVGKDLKAKKEILNSKKAYNKEIASAKNRLYPNVKEADLTQEQLNKIQTDSQVKKALETHQNVLNKHKDFLKPSRQTQEKLAVENKLEQTEMAQQSLLIDEAEQAFLNEEIEGYLSSNVENVASAPSQAEAMADKASDALAQEQNRVRGMSIDRRKIHRQSNRERNRIRASKKNGGMTNG